jgi:hypothetical protein
MENKKGKEKQQNEIGKEKQQEEQQNEIGKEEQQQQKKQPSAIDLWEIRQILYLLERMEKQIRSLGTHRIKDWIELAEMLWTIYDGISECLETGKYAIGIEFAGFLDDKLKRGLVKLTRSILYDICYESSTRGLTDIREMRISKKTSFALTQLTDTINEIKKLYTETIFS